MDPSSTTSEAGGGLPTGELTAGRGLRTIRRLFTIQALVVVGVVAGLVLIHFLVTAKEIGQVPADIAFFGGLVVAMVVLIASNRIIRQQTNQFFAHLQEVNLGSIQSLQQALEARDGYTGGHVDAARELCIRTGRTLGLSDAEIEALALAALFHDIGKIGIPDSILNKPGPLDEEEWELMRRHTDIGADILSPLQALSPVVPIVRYGHER